MDYKSLSFWNFGDKSKEGWYNAPGSRGYELNTHMAMPTGPVYGPKTSVKHNMLHAYKQALSTNAAIGIVAAVVIAVILLVAFVLFMMMKKKQVEIPSVSYYF